MKIIDLLNKIANGEEIGKIKIMGMEYYIDDGNFLCDEFGRVEWFIDDEWLNMPVEIIEEDKKIEKLREPLFQDETLEYVKLIQCKINEIIDYLEDKQC